MAAKKKSQTTKKARSGAGAKGARRGKVAVEQSSRTVASRNVGKKTTKKASKTATKKASKTATKKTSKTAIKKTSKTATKKTSKTATMPTTSKARTVAAARAKAPRANEAPSSSGLGVGDRVPDFSLTDQAGSTVSSEQLRGAPFVLYFYPKDDTPGCTKEACGFNDELERFEGLGVKVVGVSPDSQASHQRFAQKYGLKFTLLSDPDHVLATACGVYALKKNYGREYMGIVRTTFLIDQAGMIEKVWRGVRVAGHIPEVLAAVSD